MCKLTAPAIRSAAAYFHTAVEEVDSDDDRNEHLVKKYDIMSLPTIIIVDVTGEVYRTTGGKNANTLIEEFSNYLNV
ncbi:hypothetical protein HGB13_00095 [bacterium]|nr:hypothetical protein [bacterium]